MIKFKFTEPNESSPFGSINIELDNETDSFLFSIPVILKIESTVSGKTLWENEVYPGCWSGFGSMCNTKSQMIWENKILDEFVWNTFLHGDFAHQYMMLWSLRNQGSFGISIGTYDGETGEWVEPIRKNLLNALLVEGSEKKFEDLKQNYSGFSNCETLQKIITPKGGEIIFWESDDFPYANSCKESHIKNFSGEITPRKSDSLSLNELIKKQEKEVKWIHLDVEGLDSELILSLEDEIISSLDLIIFESINLNNQELEKTKNFLINKGFKMKESGWNTVAFRN